MPASSPHTSLAMSLDSWRSEIGRYFGFGRTYSSMTASQQADVDAVIDRGMRQFYAPPLLQDGTAHIWSFMRPTMNIVVHAPYSEDGDPGNGCTLVDAAPTAYATFFGATIPTWCTNGVLEYTHPDTDQNCIIHIHARVSNSQVNLEDAVDADDFIIAVGNGIAFTITDAIYALPTSFGGIEGDITLEAASGYMPVRQVGDDQIREMFLNTLIQTGTPAYFCVRPWRDPGIDRLGTNGTAGMYTRYELVFFPRPDRTLRLSFRYLFVFPGVADWIATGNATTDIHPPGMAYHHETMLASCLSIAEQYADSPNSEHRDYFSKRIAASVALDRKTAGSAYFGRNLDRSDTLYSQGRSPLSTDITYNNTLY